MSPNDTPTDDLPNDSEDIQFESESSIQAGDPGKATQNSSKHLHIGNPVDHSESDSEAYSTTGSEDSQLHEQNPQLVSAL